MYTALADTVGMAINMGKFEQGCVIEAASATDRDAIVELFADDLKQQNIDFDRTELQAVFDALNTSSLTILLVARIEAAGQAVGVLTANEFTSVKSGGRSLWIEQLYVHHAVRRRGIGRALVAGLLDLALERGIRGIDLEAYHGNSAAGLLYRSLGFRRLGRERFNFHFDWYDEFDR